MKGLIFFVKFNFYGKPAVLRFTRFFFFSSIFLTGYAKAQELNCSVQISSQQLSDVDKTLTDAMQKSIYEFINNRKWTEDNYLQHEKIDCSILINLTERVSTDEFKATINIQSRRPVYRTSYNTNMLSYLDNDFQFRYVQFETLEYSENSYVSELTSVLSFYVYMILGMDYDSFSLNGGTAYYQKALQIVNNAQTSKYKGWKAFEDTRNRYWMVNNILDQPFKPLRECLYKYHLQGFDIMNEKVAEGRTAVTEALQLLQPLYRNRPNNFSMQLFFQAKMDELVKLYSSANPDEKPKIVNLLAEMDPGHSSKYQQILTAK
jgi:hypothetical protein